MCPICTLTYNSTANVPKTAQCGHTMCQSCVNSYLIYANTPQCPFCKKHIFVDRLVTVFALIPTVNLSSVNSNKNCIDNTGNKSKENLEIIVSSLDDDIAIFLSSLDQYDLKDKQESEVKDELFLSTITSLTVLLDRIEKLRVEHSISDDYSNRLEDEMKSKMKDVFGELYIEGLLDEQEIQEIQNVEDNYEDGQVGQNRNYVADEMLQNLLQFKQRMNKYDKVRQNRNYVANEMLQNLLQFRQHMNETLNRNLLMIEQEQIQREKTQREQEVLNSATWTDIIPRNTDENHALLHGSEKLQCRKRGVFKRLFSGNSDKHKDYTDQPQRRGFFKKLFSGNWNEYES